MPPKKALASFEGMTLSRLHILLAIIAQFVMLIWLGATWVATQDTKNSSYEHQLAEQRGQISKLADNAADVKQQLAVLTERTGTLVENTREMKQLLKERGR